MTEPLGTAGGTSAVQKENVLPAHADKTFCQKHLLDSRGGTRTHDPGIMSAVL